MSDQGQPGWMPPQAPPPAPYGAPAGWQPNPYQYGYPRPADTNGFAIASLVCSLVGVIIWFIGPLLGVIFGVIGLNQAQRLGQRGRGLAIAGIVIGGVVLLVNVIAIIGLVAAGTTSVSPTI